MKFLMILISICLLNSSCKDSFVEPEIQFVQLYFKYGFKNELNTFENTFQKDLVVDGVIKVKFWLSAEEQNKIIEKANTLNFFSMPDTFKNISEDNIALSVSPDPGKQVLRIKFSSNDKTTIWRYPLLENDERFNQLLELHQFIIAIIESKPEYKSLPEANGGYM